MSSKENLYQSQINKFGHDDDTNRTLTHNAKMSSSTMRGIPVTSLLQMGVDPSKINYISAWDTDLKRRNTAITPKKFSKRGTNFTTINQKAKDDIPTQEFPLHMSPLMNEDRLWGCFYNFPELYEDIYSPVVSVRDAPAADDGVLTRDVVAACLTYLKRTPILGDLVYIKLELPLKVLTNIDVLQHYKYIVHLDLSSNLLTELKPLARLRYLQFVSVSFNRLNSVLDYDTAQWFLTEVHYKFNSVMSIRDLSAFWSIAVLDLSHNNIKHIAGLKTLSYLRHLDLSFNHIERLENLSHLRLLWLDVSYNNISTFEFGDDAGLWTLLHLEYLNINENNLTSMKIFSGCSRLQEIHARNNRLSVLLELAVYMRHLCRLAVLDFRSNPVCGAPGYADVVVNTFPALLNLDDEILEPIEQRTAKTNLAPDVTSFATRRLLRLLYIEQLSRARVSPHSLPADTREVPLVVLVGYEAVGKGALARRAAAACGGGVRLATRHTTARCHHSGHYIEVSRREFDDMLLRGEFLTYSELDGESYGLCKKEAYVCEGKITIACMDLIGALMLQLRGLRPYLVLASYCDKCTLSRRQRERKAARNAFNEQKQSTEAMYEMSTLQVLLSGRIIINGILNEIVNTLPDEQERAEFTVDSECSLPIDNKDSQESRRGKLIASSTSSVDVCKSDQDKSSQIDISLFSLYKEQHSGDIFVSDFNDKFSQHFPCAKPNEPRQSIIKSELAATRRKSVDFNKNASFPCKGSKSSKSVTFTSQDNPFLTEQEMEMSITSVGTDRDWPKTTTSKTVLRAEPLLESRESDLWLAFLMETGLISPRELIAKTLDTSYHNIKTEDLEFVMKQFGCSYEQTLDKSISDIKEEYENVHRKTPGLFWDTVTMDNPDLAFQKLNKIIYDIVLSQNHIKPLLDIDYANTDRYPLVQMRLQNIRKQIAPQRLFY